jgi:hypothetical protein
MEEEYVNVVVEDEQQPGNAPASEQQLPRVPSEVCFVFFSFLRKN